ncbi:hypothetical protein [Tenacibaculum singaporense]|nr:hypothetical protein [Tenacibaculum singaporense]
MKIKVINIKEIDKFMNEENNFWREKLVWYELFKVAKHIISNKAAIIFH